jgi:CheY-like chemotaxis protein
VLGKTELRPQPLDLAVVATHALASLSASGRGGRHRITSELGEAWVNGDPVRLEQVISNLLMNAVKYTPEGGRISIATAREGALCSIRVTDDGHGLPAELAARAFDLFVQGRRAIDRSQGGLGIGLTLVRRLAELHGGLADVHSDGENLGSTFTVRIPAIERPASLASSPAPALPGTRTVLIIEDNEDARDSLEALLKALGHRVAVAGDGVTGLETALALAPDLAIVDLGLPGLDGFEIARRLRSLAAMNGTYLAALTGYGGEDDRARALAAGFDAHITKPVSLESLQALLARTKQAFTTT